MPPPTMRVRPGDPATGLMRPSGPSIVAPDDRNFRHQQAQYGDGIATGDWRTGFGMPEDLSTVGGSQGWRSAFNPAMNLAPAGLEKVNGLNGGDQTNPALAKMIRGDAAEMGDLTGTDLGAQLQGYMQEQANRLDPFGGPALDRQTLQAAFGSPNMLNGADTKAVADDAGDVGVPTGFRAPDGSTWDGSSWQQSSMADDAGDVGVPTGFRAPDGSTWDGTNWQSSKAASSGSLDGTTANPAGMSGFRMGDQMAPGDFQVKPLKNSPWGSADELWNAFRGAAGGQG